MVALGARVLLVVVGSAAAVPLKECVVGDEALPTMPLTPKPAPMVVVLVPQYEMYSSTMTRERVVVLTGTPMSVTVKVPLPV